jgi:uncharacterized surface protein with fasciclin (FAS1) repeats
MFSQSTFVATVLALVSGTSLCVGFRHFPEEAPIESVFAHLGHSARRRAQYAPYLLIFICLCGGFPVVCPGDRMLWLPRNRGVSLPLALGTRSSHAPHTLLTRSSHECPSPPAVASAQGPACSADIPTIGELAGSAPELSTLVAAVKAANLTDVLSLPGPIDVFAPTNDAFGALLSSLNISAETLLAETALLTNVLQYHVVVDGAVCDGDLSGAVETAQGDALTVDGSTVTDANGGVANVLSAIDAGNGVVYVIDAVLLPAPSVVGAGASPVAEGASAQDVFNALDADGDGLVTEAELRAAAEARGIQLTEEQVAAFLAADADGDGVDVDEYINSLDWTVRGEKQCLGGILFWVCPGDSDGPGLYD